MRTRLNLEPTRHTVVLLACTSGAALLLCGAILGYGWTLIGKEKKELVARQTQVEEGQRIATKLENTQARYFDSLKELHYLEKTTSTRAYIPTLLKQFEGLGKSVGLKVVAVRPIVELVQQQPQPAATEEGKEGQAAAPKKPVKPPYESQRIDISVEGNYSNALSFLYRLTTFPKILTVNSVEMNPRVPGNTTSLAGGNLEIKFNVTAFVLDPPKTAPVAPKEPAKA